MNKGHELIKNTAIIFVGRFASQFLIFFLLPLYTRYLNPEEYGEIDVIITYITLLTPIITLQQEMATFRFLVDVRTSAKSESDSIIATSFYTITRNIIVFTVIYIPFAILLELSFPILIWMDIVSHAYFNMALQILRGKGDNTKYSIASFLVGLVTVISNLLLIILLQVGSKGILLSDILSKTAGVSFIFVSLKLWTSLSRKNKNAATCKEMINYGVPLIPNSISWWLINASDKVIISTFLSYYANGIYAVSGKFSTILSSLFGVFSLSWTESISQHINENDCCEFTSKVMESVIRFFSALSLGIIACMPFVFSIFIGEEYNEAYMYIPIHIISSFFHCTVGVLSSIYIAKKKTKKVANTSIFAATINLIVDFALIKVIGIYAACISTLIAFMLMTITRYIDINKDMPIKLNTKLLMAVSLLTIIVVSAYYLRKSYLNIICLLTTVAFAFFANWEFVSKIVNSIKQFIKSKQPVK